LNGEREQALDKTVTRADTLGEFTIIRRGKKKYFVIRHV